MPFASYERGHLQILYILVSAARRRWGGGGGLEDKEQGLFKANADS